MTLPTYSVVSPVRDEAEHLSRTAASLVSQSHRPLEWVIVDDGSTDGTREIAESWAAGHDWISVVSGPADHKRARGAPIVAAFKHGMGQLREQPDIVVKLDGDLFLPAHYFDWVASVFDRDPRAGVVGGTVWIPEGGRWRPDYGRTWHNVNGVAKSYRLSCLEDIGGLRESMGWDGIDEYAARARDWHVHALSELAILHYKPRGSKQPWRQARWEEGLGGSYMGYLPSFMLLRVGYRALTERPRILGGLVLGAGWLWARLRRASRVDDPLAIAELRREQRARIRSLLGLGGTVVAPAALPDGGPAYWFSGEEAARLPADTARAGDPSDTAR
jgi:biofilm PGA synthesis N-glycosyltransferase PgaC